MKNILFILFTCSFILAGCNDIVDAISGINSKANEAAEAISEDVHTLRSIELQLEGPEYVTVNGLIKAILRDVQWKHEKKGESELLIINGTWKEGLFEDYEFTLDEKNTLKEKGQVTVELFFKDKQLQVDLTNVNLIIKPNHPLVELHGEEAFRSIKNTYR